MNNLRGIFLVIGAMLAFSLGDVFIKALSATLSTGHILFAIGGASALLVAGFAKAKGIRFSTPSAWQPLILLRAACDGLAAVFFTTALARVDLSTVAAVFQTLPLVITFGAALFLREKVGWRRWSAVTVGFAGVLMIIQPGLDGFDPDTLWVLGAVVLVSARDLITRHADASVSSHLLGVQGMAALFLAGGALMILAPRAPGLIDGPVVLYLIGAVVFNILGYFGIMTAMRIGEASVVAPFRYSRLVFSVAGGVIVFGERPDLPTLLGATLIIASGLYTFVRERKLATPIVPARPDQSTE